MEYTKSDLENLRYLRDHIELTRLILAFIAYVWSLDKDVADKESIREHFEKLSRKHGNSREKY